MMAANLRHPQGRQDRVVAEDAAEIVLVGKDLVLQGKHYPGRVDEIDQGQAVDHRDPLARSTFLAVMGKNEPAFTVASLATIMNRRPRRCRRRRSRWRRERAPTRRTSPTPQTGRTRKNVLSGSIRRAIRSRR